MPMTTCTSSIRSVGTASRPEPPPQQLAAAGPATITYAPAGAAAATAAVDARRFTQEASAVMASAVRIAAEGARADLAECGARQTCSCQSAPFVLRVTLSAVDISVRHRGESLHRARAMIHTEQLDINISQLCLRRLWLHRANCIH